MSSTLVSRLLGSDKGWYSHVRWSLRRSARGNATSSHLLIIWGLYRAGGLNQPPRLYFGIDWQRGVHTSGAGLWRTEKTTAWVSSSAHYPPAKPCKSCSLMQTSTATAWQQLIGRSWGFSLCLQHNPGTLNKRALKKLFLPCFLPLRLAVAVPKQWDRKRLLVWLCSSLNFSAITQSLVKSLGRKSLHPRICDLGVWCATCI